MDLRNLQEQFKKTFCYQKLFWPFTVRINCSSDRKTFENSWTSASKFKNFPRSLEQFFLTVSQNNFGNKIPLVIERTIISGLFLWKNMCCNSGPCIVQFYIQYILLHSWFEFLVVVYVEPKKCTLKQKNIYGYHGLLFITVLVRTLQYKDFFKIFFSQGRIL